jgi:hypothetical protein
MLEKHNPPLKSWRPHIWKKLFFTIIWSRCVNLSDTDSWASQFFAVVDVLGTGGYSSIPGLYPAWSLKISTHISKCPMVQDHPWVRTTDLKHEYEIVHAVNKPCRNTCIWNMSGGIFSFFFIYKICCRWCWGLNVGVLHLLEKHSTTWVSHTASPFCFPDRVSLFCQYWSRTAIFIAPPPMQLGLQTHAPCLSPPHPLFCNGFTM